MKNPHERDAYIAAIHAYNAYSNKFKQIEHMVQQSSISNVEQIKAKVVGRHSIKEAMENREGEQEVISASDFCAARCALPASLYRSQAPQ